MKLSKETYCDVNGQLYTVMFGEYSENMFFGEKCFVC